MLEFLMGLITGFTSTAEVEKDMAKDTGGLIGEIIKESTEVYHELDD